MAVASHAILALSLVAIAIPTAAAGNETAPAAAESAELKRLLDKADQLWTGSRSAITMTMVVKTTRYERELGLSLWSSGKDKMLVRVTAPPKEQGIATLKLGDEMYNYLPKVGRTIKISAALRSGSWMGSHFTNDEILQASHLGDDFEAKIITRQTDRNDQGAPVTLWTVDLKPRANVPVAWSKMRLVLERETGIKRSAEFFDDGGVKVRTATFADVGLLGGKRVPTRIKVVPAQPPGEFTEMHYQSINAKITFDPDFFSVTRLPAL